MKRILTFFAAFCLTLTLHAQQAPLDSAAFQPDESIAFAQYDTLALEMDLYFPSDEAETHPCIIYSYGGGFIDNNSVTSIPATSAASWPMTVSWSSPRTTASA